MQNEPVLLLQKQVDYLGLEVARLRYEVDVLTLRLTGQTPGLAYSDKNKGVTAELQRHGLSAPYPDNYEDVKAKFAKMSPRHHAAMQMLMRGADNKEIGDRFGVGESGAKTYVWGLYKNLGLTKSDGHNKRAIAVGLVKATFDAIDDEEYVRLAGIPKDWDARYDEIGPEWQHVFDRSSRIKGR